MLNIEPLSPTLAASQAALVQMLVDQEVQAAGEKRREYEKEVEKEDVRRQRLMPANSQNLQVQKRSLASSQALQALLKTFTKAERENFLNKVRAFEGSFAHLKKLVAEKAQPDVLASAIQAVDKASKEVSDAIPKKVHDNHDEIAISIWYLLAHFMSDDIMTINEKEESAAMLQVQLNAQQLQNVSNHLSQINPQLQSTKTINPWYTAGFWVAAIGVGLLLAIPTGGLSLAAGITIASIATAQSSQGSGPFSFLAQENAPSTAQLTEASNTQVEWTNIGTMANQAEQTTMQLHVTQPTQIISQAGQEFSQMIQGAVQAANTQIS